MAITSIATGARVLTVFESAMSQLVKTTKLYDYNNAPRPITTTPSPSIARPSITLPR
jgi:hypothetical protein